MTLPELFATAVGLSMDAFAVAICMGLCLQDGKWKSAVIVGGYFGVFQAGMPLIGFILGAQFSKYITSIDHWLAFALLSFIGIKMVKESLSKGDDARKDKMSLQWRFMLSMAIATSIDALAVGISFAFLQVQIFSAIVFIGTVTFFLSALGVGIGKRVGEKFKTGAELLGGFILAGMGVKILLEHLGLLT